MLFLRDQNTHIHAYQRISKTFPSPTRRESQEKYEISNWQESEFCNFVVCYSNTKTRISRTKSTIEKKAHRNRIDWEWTKWNRIRKREGKETSERILIKIEQNTLKSFVLKWIKMRLCARERDRMNGECRLREYNKMT